MSTPASEPSTPADDPVKPERVVTDSFTIEARVEGQSLADLHAKAVFLLELATDGIEKIGPSHRSVVRFNRVRFLDALPETHNFAADASISVEVYASA